MQKIGSFYSGKVMRPNLNALLILVCLLLIYGLLMMTSASVEIAKSQYGDAFYFFKRQGIFALVGLFVLFITLHIPTVLWKKYSWVFLLGSFLLLILVLVPGIGKIVNGSARWIDLGFFNLQPSELAKIFIVIYLASYLDDNLKEVKQTWAGFMKPIFIIVAAAFLLQLEPDHGALVILMLTSFCMIFLAGAKIYRFLPMFVVCAGAITYLAMTKSYVIARFSSFLNPWAAENVFDSSYQLTQALIAFGRGEWFGVGLGNSIQKLYFLPEAHNDFVLAIVGEELGLVGVSVVLVLFCLLVLPRSLLVRLPRRMAVYFKLS